MGCDIHGLIQTPIGKRWVTALALGFTPRDYRMFEALAGVRGAGRPVVQPKGLPDYWECEHSSEEHELHECPLNPDSHTLTWLTINELETVFDKVTPGPAYAALLAAMRALGEPVRIVLWFDN